MALIDSWSRRRQRDRGSPCEVVDKDEREVEISGTSETRLVNELPPEIDRALVAKGYKGKLGVPALNYAGA
ncbi:hypothetical protein WKW79_36175 [Variovorax robiniae]|uniref:Uncharacterized protein n=1 Tax=Variovorax robiniae TaxID=1836199 RepID=A0ABU8XJY7_9BURK